MKSHFIVLAVSFCLFSNLSAVAENIVFKKADLKDLPTLLELVHQQDEEDRKNLVVYPPQIEAEKYRSAIGEGIYLALDHITAELEIPVSMLKLYQVRPDDIDEKLEEVGFLVSDPKLLLSESFVIPHPTEKAAFFKSRANANLPFVPSSPNRTAYLYYGAAFTLHNYRGRGIHSRLTEFAVSSLTAEIKKQQPDQVTLLYGQVLSNTKNQTMIFDVANSLDKLFPDSLKNIQHFGYSATKPSIDYNLATKSISYSFPPEGAGQGSIVVYSLSQDGENHE